MPKIEMNLNNPSFVFLSISGVFLRLTNMLRLLFTSYNGGFEHSMCPSCLTLALLSAIYRRLLITFADILVPDHN